MRKNRYIRPKKHGVRMKFFGFWFLLLTIFLNILGCAGMSVMALTSSQSKTFSINNILFYDPCSKNNGAMKSCWEGKEVTWEDLDKIAEGDTRTSITLLAETYGELAMELQEEYGVPWELVFIQMGNESGGGVNRTGSVAINIRDKDGKYNLLGMDVPSNPLNNQWRSDSTYPYVDPNNGVSHEAAEYDSISLMIIGFFIAYYRNGVYDEALKQWGYENFDFWTGFQGAKCNYVGTCGGEYAGTSGEWFYNVVSDVAKGKGWPSSEELAKQKEIGVGGNWPQLGDIRQEAFEKYGLAGRPNAVCSGASKSSDGTNSGGGDNKNYADDDVFSEAERQAISEHKSVYQEAAEEYGIPWQILAVLHKIEHSLIKDNPANGQGVYQLYSYTGGGTNENRFEPGNITDEEFLRQSKIVASLIKENYGAGLDLNTDDGIKEMFFRYNGSAQVYIQQALSLGFSEEEAKRGEGSPYVMNRYDERRDPNVASTSNNNSWGMIKSDGGTIEYPAPAGLFGAYVMYVALAGENSSSNNNSSCGNTSGNGTGINGVSIDLTEGKPVLMNDLIPSDAYLAAMQEVGTYGNCAFNGASCDCFVSTVIRKVGIDKNFPYAIAECLGEYMYESSDWQQIENTNDPNILEPGDVLVVPPVGEIIGDGSCNSGGHIKIYIEKDGQPATAHASYGERTGQWENGITMTDGERGDYYIFRYIGKNNV